MLWRVNLIKESKIEYGTVTGKVVCDGAKIFCPAGGESVLKSSKQSFFKINGKNVILESEITSSNITKFKACAVEKNKKCNPIVKKNWDNTVEHLSTLKENVVTTFSQVVCLKGMLPIIIRDGNQQGVEYGATAKVTRTEGATADDGKADDKKKDTKEIKDAVAVKLEEKKSAVAKIDYTAVSGKLPIKKGEKGEIVREINIRLMGFGGGLPSDEYNDYTVKVVKQFKEDYMGLKNADGTFVDMATIQAIDKFADEYPITETEFNQMKCPCRRCNGFGYDKTVKGKKDYKKKIKDKNGRVIGLKIEKYSYIEYPGMHKALLWVVRSSKFYLNKSGYYITSISSGYRCSIDNTNHDLRGTKNHMGNALDLHIGIIKTKKRTKNKDTIDNIRRKVFVKNCGAVMGWAYNKIGLETLNEGADTWIHVDVREYGNYMEDKFYINTKDGIIAPKKLGELIK